MLFGGGNPWQGRRWAGQQTQQPAQVTQQFQPPQVSWPQPPSDLNYANQLAQHYASQMPNQQVPGSAPLPMAPPQQVPQVPQPVAQQPVATDGTGWMDAWKQARMGWRSARPDNRSLLADWKDARPSARQFRLGQ